MGISTAVRSGLERVRAAWRRVSEWAEKVATAAGKVDAWGRRVPWWAWAATIVLLLVAQCSRAAIPGTIAITLAPNVDNTFSPVYRTGNKPPGPSLLACDDSAAAALLTELQNGAGAFSTDYRQFFTGTAKATATLSVVTIAGSNAATNGWAISSAGAGDNLTNPRTTNGAGSLLVRGTTGGYSADCRARNWSVVTPPVVDSTAPTVPYGLACAGGATTGTAVCAWDPSTDPNANPTGVLNYDFTVGGIVDSTVTGVAGLSPTLTETIIGSSDGTPSSSVSGSSVDLSFGGAGMDSTTDQIIFRGAAVAGDQFVSGAVTALTSAAGFPKAGVMLRETTTSGAIGGSVYYQGNGRVQMRCRVTTGGTNASVATQTVSLPLYVKLARVSTLLTGYYSTDGAAWQTLGSCTAPMTASVQSGVFLTSGSAGTNATATVSNLAQSTAPALSKTYTTSVPVTVTVRARDVSGNLSAQSASVTATPSSAPVGDVTAPTCTGVGTGTPLGQTQIQWTAPVCSDAVGIRGYIFSYATTSGGTYTAQAEQVSNTIVQSGLSSATAYYAKVKAVDTSGNVGSDTAFFTATTDGSTPSFTAPTISSVAAASQTALTVTHTAVAGADHYIVRRATSLTGSYSEVATLDHTGLTFTDSGLTAGTTRCYQVGPSDASETTTGPYSTGVCGTTSSPPSAAAKKWHPGHYVQMLRGDSTLSGRFTKYDQMNLGSLTNVKGVGVYYRWSQLEPTQGDYSAGISLIQAEVAKLKTYGTGKRLIISIMDSHYGGTITSSYFPQYVKDASCVYQGGVQAAVKKWNATCRGYLINMLKALGAAFDSEPYVEAIKIWRETAPGFGSANSSTGNFSDYSESANLTGLKDIVERVAPSWPTTNVVGIANWLSNSAMTSLYTTYAANNVGNGSPDNCSTCNITGDLVMIGSIGTIDYRRVIPNFSSVEVSELGYNAVGPSGGFTAAQVFTYANSTLRATHMIWDYNTVTGNATTQRWDGAQGELATINANPLTYTSCPAAYANGCNTN